MDLVQVINEMRNPFTNDTPELLALDTRDVIDNSVVNTVRTVEDTGKEKQKSSSNKSVVAHLHNPSMISSRSLSSACSDFQHQRQKQADGTCLPVEEWRYSIFPPLHSYAVSSWRHGHILQA